MQSYYREAFSEGPCASQGFKSLYQNLQVRTEGNQLFIEGSEAIDKEHFKKNHLPNFSQTTWKVWLSNFQLSSREKWCADSRQEEAFHAENEQIVQAANEEALRAMEQLEQMAPPPAEEKPAFDFQAKKAAAKPKLDKAEITPMIEVTTEENRLVFEGVVFDVEQKSDQNRACFDQL